MDKKRLRRRWKEIRKHQSKDYRIGWLGQMMSFAEQMPDGAYAGFMQEILGEDWAEILEEHGLTQEYKDA